MFLEPSRRGAACSIYDVRPHDCRVWFVHGVEDGSFCGPGAPLRALAHVTLPDREEEDVHLRRHLRPRPTPRPTWVPLALGVLAALDLLELGPAGLARWQERLDAATARSFALVDEPE